MTTTTTTAIELQHRFVQIEGSKDKSDTLEFSFSSEEPVQRYFGDEVLDHDEKSVDLTRLNSGVAPLLFNHDQDIVLGVVSRAWIQDRKGRAEIRWAENPKAKEVRADVENNILRGISVGYTINKAEQEGEITRAVSWFPHELSVVSIPADFKSIGIGRTLPPSQPSTSKKEMSYVMDGVLPEQNQGEFETECRNFSIIEAAKGIASGRGLAGRELEVNQELETRNGKRTQGFYVPNNGWSSRAYVAGTASAGGNLIETEVLADQFVEALRNRLVVGELGARVLPNLTGNVSIPTRSGDNTAYWIAGDNGDSVTESTGTVGSISMTPKTVGAWSKFSHLMKLQATPEIEQFIRDGFIAIIAEAIDTAALNGSGSSNQPTGILNTSGIGSVAMGTNGAVPTIDKMLDLKKEVSVDNADIETCAYVTNSKVENALAQLKDGNSAYHLNPYGAEIGKQQLASRRFVVSNSIPSNLTKGSGSSLSAAIYGNFRDLIIGTWSSPEILVDPYTDFSKGTTGLRILQSIDIAVAHSSSFSAIKDIVAS